MSFAISKRDQSLLLGVLGVIFLFVSWYFVYTPLNEKTVALETENISLKQTADFYQEINANLSKYEAGIEEFQEQITEISNHYPSDISRVDEIMFLANMENVYARDLAVDNITMSSVTEVFAETSTQDTESVTETAEGETQALDIHLYQQTSNYSFRCTYSGAKAMIHYLMAQTNRKEIEGLSLAFDSETGNLIGSLDLNQYYMTGLDKEYQAIPTPSVLKGVEDVFHTINGDTGVNAVVEEE